MKRADFVLEDGGMKSSKRVFEKLREKTTPERPHPALTDLSRMRITVPDFTSFSLLNRIADDLLSERTNLWFVRVLAWIFARQNKYDTPFRSMNAIMQGRRRDKPADRLLTEVQFVTRRMRAGTDLNHPFDVRKSVSYPSAEHKAWMHGVMLKASILDFREFLDGRKA